MSLKKRVIRPYYRKLRRPFEWLAIWLALRIIPPLSPRGVVRLADWIADTVFLFDRRGKAVSHANLQVIFGAGRLSPKRRNAIIHKAYRNMARVMVNVIWMSRDTLQRLQQHVRVDPCVKEALLKHRPLVTVSAHIGNWEILSQAVIMLGAPIMSVAQEFGSPEMTERLIAMRSTIGQEIILAEGALRHLLKALREGTSIGLLIDQHVAPQDGGAWVDFFGLPTTISLAPAILARKIELPILFAWSQPLKNGDYLIKPGLFMQHDFSDDDHEITRELVAAFEGVIRRHPSLWCLNYRRWRHIPPEANPHKYPFYARQLDCRIEM